MLDSKMGFVLALFLLVLINNINCQTPEKDKDDDKDKTATQQVYLYRLLNWCIIGKGEYMLDDWPLTQFKPILQMTRKNELMYQNDNKAKITEVNSAAGDVWNFYELVFFPITCNPLRDTGLGVGHSSFTSAQGNSRFFQRMHVKFKPIEGEEESAPAFQGLLIQAVHAPFSLGFPFGVFDTDQEFQCKDCNYTRYSRILGCISRPDISTMHPTVGIYHFKLPVLEKKKKSEPNDAGQNEQPAAGAATDDEYEEAGYQTELHWNFKWANVPCSSARLVEFWVLMVIDFEKGAWTVKKFGPYDLNNFELSATIKPTKTGGDDGEEPPNQNQVQVEGIKLYGLPTPIISECYPFKKYPIFVNISAAGRPRSCFREFRLFDKEKCKKWYATIRAMNRTGFVNNENYANNSIECHTTPIETVVKEDLTRVRIVGDFDAKCIRRYSRSTGYKQPHKICPNWQGRFYCKGGGEEIQMDEAIPKKGAGGADRAFPDSHCTTCEPATEEITEPPSDSEPLIKRAGHGIIMIYAFFFCNPVSLNVARFYKETLHEKQIKGWRMWLIIHVGSATATSGLAYIGYTYPSFKEMTAHILLGYGALIGVSSGIVTGWVRHKVPFINLIMIYLHALSGYVGWAFAIASFIFAPGISAKTRVVSYAASGICLFAMAVMTLHIFTVDKSIGMRPSRSHIPIIEIRFEDIVPPKSKFRKFFLYGYIAVQFLICIGMLVL